MKRVLFDIESTGLLRRGSQIHCIVCRNIDDPDKVLVFDTVKNNVDEGIEYLESCDVLIGHNIAGYDIPLIKELYPEFKEPKVLDTLILSRMFHPTLGDEDHRYKPRGLPVKLRGSHGLKAWGIRLKEYKGDFAESNDWNTYTQDMLEYCIQDTKVNIRLYNKLHRENINV